MTINKDKVIPENIKKLKLCPDQMCENKILQKILVTIVNATGIAHTLSQLGVAAWCSG